MLCLRLDCNCSVLPPSRWNFHFSYSVKPSGQRSRGKDLFFPHTFLSTQTKGSWIWETKLEPNELEEDQSENTLRSKRRALLKGMGHHLRIISRGADALLVSEPQKLEWGARGWVDSRSAQRPVCDLGIGKVLKSKSKCRILKVYFQ